MSPVKRDAFAEVADYLPARPREFLDVLSASERTAAQEIRLRAGQLAAVTLPSGVRLVGERVTPEEVEECFRRLCQNSVHTYQHDISQGFVTLRRGHRAGLCGTAVLDGEGRVTGMRNIGSINIRLAREIPGAADALMGQVLRDGRLQGCLIVSPPRCGKTTMLRDLARQLSGKRYRVAVVDERSELAACRLGVPQNELGPCCDVLDGFPKAAGMLYAVRNLGPQVLICDEIGDSAEVAALLHAMNAGVKAAVSAHASGLTELLGRPDFGRLLGSGAIDCVAVLAAGERPGTIKTVIRGEELAEICGSHHDHSRQHRSGAYGLPQPAVAHIGA